MKKIVFVPILLLLLFCGCTQKESAALNKTDEISPQTTLASEEPDHAVMVKKDFSECDNVTPEDRDSCYHYQAQRKKDPLMCAEIAEADPRDECYYSLAMSTINMTLCTRIEGGLEEAVNGHGVARCYTEFAKHYGNESICKEINNSNGMNYCLAIITNNVSYCNRIHGSNIYDCKHMIDPSTLML